MTNEFQTLGEEIKGIVNSLPEDAQKAIQDHADLIRVHIDEKNPVAMIATMLVLFETVDDIESGKIKSEQFTES